MSALNFNSFWISVPVAESDIPKMLNQPCYRLKCFRMICLLLLYFLSTHCQTPIITNMFTFIGPFTEETIVDFWRMIWQEHCEKIVMVTNLLEGETVGSSNTSFEY